MTTDQPQPERYTNANCPKCGKPSLLRNIGVDGRPYLRCTRQACGYYRIEKPQQPQRGEGRIL